MRLPLLSALCLALAACSGDPLTNVDDGLVIYPSSPIARPGDPLTVHLINWSGQNLTENLCPITLQERQGTSWVSVYTEPPPDTACPAYARFFPPGRTISRGVTLPANLTEGQYRIVFQWLGMEDGPAIPEELRASQPVDIRFYLPE